MLELSFGIDRIFYALLELDYAEDKDRVLLKLQPALAPYTVAVFPLVNKDKLPERAQKVYEELKQYFDAVYDEAGSIGKRYYRQDEIGTPITITCDYQTLKDDTVTLRNRDTKKQVRVKATKLVEEIKKLTTL